MHFIDRLKASDGTLDDAILALLPGKSDAMKRLRSSVRALSSDVMARGALLTGPAGSGKTTLARAVALCRYLHFLTPQRVKEFLATVRADGAGKIAYDVLPWFIEFSLPGLAESVAEAQLFGFTKAVAGGTQESRPGIFETAARGRMPAKEEPPEGALVTDGVVFLDEVADLSAALQPKLLSVLSGARTYRVGGEGNDECGFTFKGLTLAATWRDVRDRLVLREDLHARLSDYVLDVPSLTERGADLRQLAEDCVVEVKAAFRLARDDLFKKAGKLNIDRARLEGEGDAVASFKLSEQDLRTIDETDWRRHGELRGLVQAIRRAVRSGTPIAECLGPPMLGLAQASVATAAVEWLLTQKFTEPLTLVKALNGFEEATRRDVAALLRASPEKLQALVPVLGRDLPKLKDDLRELTRA